MEKQIKKGKGRRIFAFIMALLMVVGIWNGYPAMKVKADNPSSDTIVLHFTNAAEGRVDEFSLNGNRYNPMENSNISIRPDGSNGSIVTITGLNDSTEYELSFQNGFGTDLIQAATFNGNNATIETVSGDLGDLINKVKYEVTSGYSYDITLEDGLPSNVCTIVWAYSEAEAVNRYHDQAAWVQNGTVEVVSITRNGVIIYEAGDERNYVQINDNGGYIVLMKNDTVELKLIPDYGYQFVSATANGRELAAKTDMYTFELANIQGNIHFSGIFEQRDNQIEDSSTSVAGASIANGQNATPSGNLNMKIEDTTVSNEDAVIAQVDGDNVVVKAAVNITLEQIVSKGTQGNNWTSSISEFTNPITVGIHLDSAIAPEDGQTLSVVRDHNGTLQELPATYDAASNTLYFPTNQFSTYTIVSRDKTVADEENSVSSVPSTTPGHTHLYQWVVTTKPTAQNDGVYSHICLSCGHVESTQVIGREAAFYQSVIEELERQVAAVKNGTAQQPIVLNLGDWHSIPGYVMDKIRECGMDVIVNYRYLGKEYSILIPAGKCLDLDIPWYGPLLLEHIYGNRLDRVQS